MRNYLKMIGTFFAIMVFSLCFTLSEETEAAVLVKNENYEFIDDSIFNPEEEFWVDENEVIVVFSWLFTEDNEDFSSQDKYVLTVEGRNYALEESLVYYDRKVFEPEYSLDSLWYYSDALPYGKYTLTFSSLNDDLKYIGYEIYKYPSLAASASVPTTLSIKTEKTEELKIRNILPSGSYLGADVKSSNTKIAETFYDTSDQKWYVKANSAGTCILKTTLANGRTYQTKLTVSNPAPKLNYTSLTLYKGDKEQAKLLYATKKVKWKSSNKKIATVDSKGNIKAKGFGSCTVTATSGGKKYKVKVKVQRLEPDFLGYIQTYNTRSNYFIARFYNMGEKTLTISAGNAKAKDYDYKTFDRTLRLSKSVTIKPGKIKTVKFKVKGKRTWYNHEDFWIEYKFKYDGKSYKGRIISDPSESDYKNGSKYYYTYWDTEEYYDLF